MHVLSIVGPRKVRVSRDGVASLNRAWPGSKLSSTRAYWFEFAANGDLIDTDVPEHSDGPEVVAMADDCKSWLFDDLHPEWNPA